jgi:aspartate/methionine/tyrosine aminotransferase
LCADETIINNVLRFKSNMDSGMFLPLQLAAAKALALDETWFNNLNAVYEKRRVEALALLQLLNCVANENQVGLFVWAKIPSNYKDAYQLSDEVLQTANVFITPGGIFGSNGNEYIRVSLCAPVQVFEEAIQRISLVFKTSINA